MIPFDRLTKICEARVSKPWTGTQVIPHEDMLRFALEQVEFEDTFTPEVVRALLGVAAQAELAMAEIHAQNTCWPGEVDALDDALTSLDSALKVGGK